MNTEFKRGEQVEIHSNDTGFEDSYLPATIVSQINTTTYIVQFNTLIDQKKQCPLREFCSLAVIRPVPPVIHVKKYELGQDVDAYYQDVWWKGTVAKTGTTWYRVRFDSHLINTGRGEDEAEAEVGNYLVTCLRVHQDWVRGKWVSSKKGFKA